MLDAETWPEAWRCSYEELGTKAGPKGLHMYTGGIGGTSFMLMAARFRAMEVCGTNRIATRFLQSGPEFRRWDCWE